jgi:hypothetical protein
VYEGLADLDGSPDLYCQAIQLLLWWVLGRPGKLQTIVGMSWYDMEVEMVDRLPPCRLVSLK